MDDLLSEVEQAISLAMISGTLPNERLRRTIESIDRMTMTMAAAMEQQNAATQEISRSISLAAQSSAHLRDSVNKVDQAAEETVGLSSCVDEATRALQTEIERLKSDTERLIQAFKAA